MTRLSHRRRFAWLTGFAAIAALAAAAPSPSSRSPRVVSVDPAPAAATITPSAIRGHVEFLADDLLEGRATGTRGYDLAARYVASQFEAVGLEPGGTRGWYQPVPFRRTELRRDRSSVSVLRGREVEALEIGEDFTMAGDALRETVSVTAPVVFVGYGVTAPEFDHDDYAGVNVRGKIIAMLRGAPAHFPHNERAFYAWGHTKNQNAVAHGAVGILSIRSRRDERMAPWARVARQSKLPRFEWLESTGAPHHVFPALRGIATLSRSGCEALFEGSPVPLDTAHARVETGRTRSFELPVRARIVTATRLTRIESPNVIGLLRGSDPKLKSEYVVYTGHLDHLGISEPVDGDSINNGAYDNASGIAAMIETARAFGRMPRAPRRSILFVATVGEEKGLLGADYFSEKPTVPMTSIVANINLDMFLMLFPLADVVAYGAEHSSLGAVAERAARANGFELSPDPDPAEVIFVRSDQFPFVRKGVPALFLTAGEKSKTRGIDGKKLHEEWIRTRYHAPGDDLDQRIDYDSGARFARTNFLIGWDVANRQARPTWNAGDFFGKKFGPARMAKR